FGLLLDREHTVESARNEIGQAIEGYANAKQLYELAQQHNVEMPIAECLFRVLYEGAGIRDQVLFLMGRDPRDEVG
ncbi:MAG: glycerol-3-phosphate dehydrogenase, partial [Coxiella sp. (in: Bacteria)]